MSVTNEAVIGAMRLAVWAAPDDAGALAVFRLLLAEAPDTDDGDTASVELLVRLLQERRLTVSVGNCWCEGDIGHPHPDCPTHGVGEPDTKEDA